jgi:hypothetical protein
MPIPVAIPPVSCGITESMAFPPEHLHLRTLDEIANAGYSGTDFVPYG